MMARKILLTGAHGLLGHAFAREFAAQAFSCGFGAPGFTLTTTSRQRRRAVRNIEHVPGDLSNQTHIDRIMKRGPFDVVIHAAARISPEDGDGAAASLFQDNVIASANLALAARRNRTTHFIYCSTISVYSGEGPYSEQSKTEPTIPYGASKLTTEQALRNLADENFAVTVLRFAGLHGIPRHGGVLFNFVKCALNNEPLAVAEPDSVYTLTFMNDAVKALKQVSVSDPRGTFEVYNVANPVPLSLSGLAECVIQLCDSKSEVLPGDAGKRNRVLLIDKFQNDFDIASSPIKDEIMALAADLNGDRE